MSNPSPQPNEPVADEISTMCVYGQTSRPRRKSFWLLPIIALCVTLLYLVGEPLNFYLLTGRFRPISQVEQLSSPMAVTGWTERNLTVADGRLVPLPGLNLLPKNSQALTMATAGGIEVDPEGNVFGLLRIHHWCGNDPLRNHVVRVNLAHLLMFLGEGEPRHPMRSNDPFHYTTFGWNMSQHSRFQWFEQALSIPSTMPAK